MPEQMPSDFNFSLIFGIGSKNEINTYEGYVTKDLIIDGTITVEMRFTPEEMKQIYAKMREINIASDKKLAPNNRTCDVEPHGEDWWDIQINGERIKLSVSGKYCEPTEDAKELMQLRNFIFKIVKSKDAYQELPNAKGGYE